MQRTLVASLAAVSFLTISSLAVGAPPAGPASKPVASQPAALPMPHMEALVGAKSPLRQDEHISFFGDSITMQGGFTKMIGQAIKESDHTKGLRVKLFGHGLNGGRVDTLPGGVSKWGKQLPVSELMEKDKPTAVVLFIGVNDVTHRDAVSPEQFEKGLNDLIAMMKKDGAVVVLVTPAVAGEKTGGMNSRDRKMDQYADISRKVAAENKVTLCDARKAFVEYIEKNNPENKARGVLTKDGIHMNAAGNSLLADLMAQSLAEAMQQRAK